MKSFLKMLSTMTGSRRVKDSALAETYNAYNEGGVKFDVIFLSIIVIFYVFFMLLEQRDWVLQGEMWAEMAIYYPVANSASLLEKLFSADFGYIPLPQRIIAAVANYLHFSASSIPFYYTWSAILFSAILVGVFCLTTFRQLIKSDLLRAAVCILVLVGADFETSTFINFTYFVVFFAAVMTALAFVDKSNDVPMWAWAIPLLMVSKPHALAVLPAMVVTAIFAKKRFRLITIASIVTSFIQLVTLAYYHQQGVMPSAPEVGLVTKIWVTVKYFFGFLGGYLTGPEYYPGIFDYSPTIALLLGLVFMALLFLTFIQWRGPSLSLILVGLSVMFFSTLLNVFTLGDSWPSSNRYLSSLLIDRHSITGYFGFILTFAGLIEASNENIKVRIFSYVAPQHFLGILVFFTWVVLTGWMRYGFLNSRQPVLNNSYWQSMAETIDRGEDVCVPIEPVGWLYGKNCRNIGPLITWNRFSQIGYSGGNYYVDFGAPATVSSGRLTSLAVFVRPVGQVTNPIRLKAIVTTFEGRKYELLGQRTLTPHGGLILLSSGRDVGYQQLASYPRTIHVRLFSDIPIEVAFGDGDNGSAPAVIWMGYPFL